MQIQLRAQDSVAYAKDFRLYEGLYLSYQDFRYNWPIPKEKINTKINKDQLDFYSKLLEEQEMIDYVERDGAEAKVKTEKVWGYCQNNIIYINQDNNFFRIPVFGAISNFIGTVEVVGYSPGYDPFMNAPMNSTAAKTREIRQYLFDFYSGEIVQFSVEKLEEYLKRDEAIYKEFSTLNKKKKKEFATKYIRMYNEKHVVYFPKG
ncbi:MAG: hypothetical protein C0448_02035 [Sphingobacteriaceae bacterium]|nr:hypothetical protein [Sphingobacteriaceae bacterium]